MLDNLDLVAAMALFHTSVEEARVFVTLKGHADFTPLSPKQMFGMGDSD